MEEKCIDKIMISGDLPIETLLAFEISERENEHSHMWMKIRILQTEMETFLTDNHVQKIISVREKSDEESKPIFWGKIEKINSTINMGVVISEIVCLGNTVRLDRKRKKKSYQNPKQTYTEIINEATKETHASYQWESSAKGEICQTIIQYEETDWEFLKRVTSHFHTSIFSDCYVGNIAFQIGLKRRQLKTMDRAKLVKREMLHKSWQKNDFIYRIQTEELWEKGDYVILDDREQMVFRREINFRDGELLHYYEVGSKNAFYRERIDNNRLLGKRLEGKIVKTENESIFIQLDIDKDNTAYCAWPWKPEIGNIAYIMPEVGTNAGLYFPTQKEHEAFAIHVMRKSEWGGLSDYVQNRELSTRDKKKIELYPEHLAFKGESNNVSLCLKDQTGICFASNTNLFIKAVEEIKIIGEKVNLCSPLNISCSNGISNIEIGSNFNFFAPGGVKTVGSGSDGVQLEEVVQEKREEGDHWQATITAMAAIPNTDVSKMEAGNEVQVFAEAAIPIIGSAACAANMSEIMNGKVAKNTSFPHAFSSMDNYTVKGGYLLPRE